MTIQTTNIDNSSGGDAVDLTTGSDVFLLSRTALF
jgi:hypothetical protein